MYRSRRPTSLRAVVACSALLALATGCATRDVVAPARTPTSNLDVSAAAAVTAPYVSEIHYDNVGTDADESIEITGPAGFDLTGWQIVLYNGNGGAAYNTRTLSGTIPTVCGDAGVIVATYPQDGIQNGSPDGIALVRADGTVAEFLSYEGPMTAVGGPANGMTSIDIGVFESSAPVGQSLQRSSAGIWTGPIASTVGACNAEGLTPTVTSVTVAPTTASIVQGGTQSFTATARDASNQPIAGISVTWTSSATAIATISASGTATGMAPGDAVLEGSCHG